ncbi:MAG: hypothetical protein U9R37_06070 [Campylobacterota bacterium]|nr:hypothetical protein [Campylobacterota bacterium]
MQFFGKYKEKHELEYLIKSYIYIPYKDENKEDITITVEELNSLLKKKSKNVAGTVFLYNPCTAPIGLIKNEKLSYQDFKFTDDFHELQIENEVRIVGRNLKKYAGKLIEVKYLFTYNKEDIQPTSVLEVFDMDLEKLQTNLLTVFAKDENFHDYRNISYNGKFIFFAWGHKFDRHHTNIALYASNIAQWAKKLDKEIGFIYDKAMDENGSFEYTRFFAPDSFGKLKLIIPPAIEKIFSKDKIEPLCIK